MKHNLFLLVMGVVFISTSSCPKAQTKGTGLGIVLGEPTGLSFKHWLSGNTAIDGAVAWSFDNSGDMHIHVDYLIHRFDWMKSDDPFASRVEVYYGFGGRVKFETDSRIGARGVLGLVYFFNGEPLDAFLEVAPILDLAPATEFSINAGIGFRYFFE